MKITQKNRIINYIREFGSISSWEAYSELGITQLGARIDQLKKEGYEFKTRVGTQKEQIWRRCELQEILFNRCYSRKYEPYTNSRG